MSQKTAVITLDGQQYTVHRFNLGELEQVTQLMLAESPRQAIGFKMLAIALRRAQPKIENIELIEPEAEEVAAAVRVVLDLSGMVKADAAANPPAAAAG